MWKRASIVTLPDANSLAAELADARREASVRLVAWQHFQSESASAIELSNLRDRLEVLRKQIEPFAAEIRDGRFATRLNKARTRVSNTEHALKSLYDNDYFLRKRWLQFDLIRQSFARRFGDDSIVWFVGALLFASLRMLIVLMFPTFVFANKPTELQDWVTTRNSQIASATSMRAAAKQEFITLDGISMSHNEHEATKSRILRFAEIRLEETKRAQTAYEVAKNEVKRLEALQTSRQYQLSQRKWDKLKEVPFEKFLKEVFETLGYRVELTKASGDQGGSCVDW